MILWNDDDHTYDYVIKLCRSCLATPLRKATRSPKKSTPAVCAILLTTTKEHAELKGDQVHAYGKDREIKSCKGSMSATIEPEC